LWVLLALSLAALAPQLLESRRTRRVLRAFAALQPLLTAAEVIRLPSPLLRLAVVAGAVLVVAVVLSARRRSGEPAETPLRTGARRLGAGLGAAILLLEVAGFDALARWLLGSAAATVLWAFAFVFLLRLGRWALLAAVTGRAAERFPALRWVGHHLTGRLLWLVRGALLLVGVGYLVSVWGVAVTPRRGLSEILSWELPLGFHTVRLGSILLALVTLYLGFVLSAVTRAGVDRWSSERGGVDPGVGDSIKRLLHYVVITLGFFFALGVLGFELQSLTIVLGALGVGVGFGLQNIANNFFSGLILLFERPVRVGDMVVLDGIWGTIRKIGLRSTVVQTFDQSELIVPNSDLISEKVTNWTLSDKVTRLLIPVGVAYGSDVPKVLRLLGEVAAADPRVLPEPAVQTFFVGFGDSSLDFELRVWVGDPSDRLPTRGDLLAALDRRFREEGVEIPFPQRDLHLRSVAEGAGGRLGGGERPRRA
jgi:small-conductance mechanosensitive channel